MAHTVTAGSHKSALVESSRIWAASLAPLRSKRPRHALNALSHREFRGSSPESQLENETVGDHVRDSWFMLVFEVLQIFQCAESESRSFPGAFCTPISPDFHIELTKLDPMGPNEIVPVAAVSASHFSMTKRCHFPSSGLGDTRFGACRGAPWLTQIELKLIQTIFHYRKRHQNGAV